MGKKRRKSQKAKWFKPAKKPQSNINLLPTQEQKDTTKMGSKHQARRTLVCAILTILSPAISGIGGALMSTANTIAPWLLAISTVMIAFAILFATDVWMEFTKYFRKPSQQVVVLVVIGALLFVPVLAVFYRMADDQRAELAKITILNGELTYGKEPTPAFPFVPPKFGIPPYEFIVMLGDNNAFFIDGAVDNAFYVEAYPLLTIKSNKNGKILFDTQIIDSSMNTVVKVIENQFKSFEDYSFNSQQPDKHSLIVRDLEGVEVLNIKYINKKVLKISGRFFSPESSRMVAISSNGEIQLGWGTLWGIAAPVSPGEKIFLGEPPKEFSK